MSGRNDTVVRHGGNRPSPNKIAGRVLWRLCAAVFGGVSGYLLFMLAAIFRLALHRDVGAIWAYHGLGTLVGCLAASTGLCFEGLSRPKAPMAIALLIVVPVLLVYGVQDYPSQLWLARTLRYSVFFAGVPGIVLSATMVAMAIHRAGYRLGYVE